MITDTLPPIRQWSDLDGVTLTPAEHKLIGAAKAGNWAKIGEGVPKTKTNEVLIRAPLLRYLILGGCEECRTDAVGAPLSGAWIAGDLDVFFINTAKPIWFLNCLFENHLLLQRAKLRDLTLMGSEFSKGLTAEGIEVSGDVNLSNIVSKEGIGFRGACILGQMDLSEAILRSAGKVTLNLDRVKIGGNLELNNLCADRQADDAKEQNATVRLMDATISGQLNFQEASIANTKGEAIVAQRMVVKSSFLWRKLINIHGAI